jgi:hypothetical protein
LSSTPNTSPPGTNDSVAWDVRDCIATADTKSASFSIMGWYSRPKRWRCRHSIFNQVVYGRTQRLCRNWRANRFVNNKFRQFKDEGGGTGRGSSVVCTRESLYIIPGMLTSHLCRTFLLCLSFSLNAVHHSTPFTLSNQDRSYLQVHLTRQLCPSVMDLHFQQYLSGCKQLMILGPSPVSVHRNLFPSLVKRCSHFHHL